MDFQDLKAYQSVFENYLQTHGPGWPQADTLTEPARYLMNQGGKRIRPLLTLLSCHLFREDFQTALPQAMSVETFHNFTLMHDDIMDQAPTRRGQPTVHQAYGLNAAILSGDALLIRSYQYLTEGLSAVQTVSALSLFSETAMDICRGQQMDMDFEKDTVIPLDQYLEMIKNKTAVLLGLSMSLGGLTGGTSPEAIAALRRCGECAGMAFQIHDDYLDAFGNPEVTGKQRGGDILQNKKTFLWVKAYQLGNERIRQELVTLYQPGSVSNQNKINRVLEIFHSFELESHCRQLQINYTDQAVEALNAVQATEESKQRIFDLMILLLARSR